MSLHRRATRDPERVERDRDAYERTERVLLGLSADRCAGVNAYALPHEQHGHVIVGPAGVHLLISRKPLGSVRVKDGVPWFRPGADSQSERPGTDVVRKVSEPAKALARDLHDATELAVTVHPIVVLWCEFPQRVVETAEVVFVQGRELAGWLRARPAELNRRPELDALVASIGTIAEKRAPGSQAA